VTQGEHVHRSDEATDLEIEHPGLDREAIGPPGLFLLGGTRFVE